MNYDDKLPKWIECKRCGWEFEGHDLIKIDYYENLHFYCKECYKSKKLEELYDSHIINDTDEIGYF